MKPLAEKNQAKLIKITHLDEDLEVDASSVSTNGGREQGEQTITITEKVISPESIIEGSAYLAQYPDWLTFYGTKRDHSYSPNFVNRNNIIWEYIAGERSYCAMLVILPVVYNELFPVNPTNKEETSDSFVKDRKMLHQALFTSLPELVQEHCRILQGLVELHNENKDHIVQHLGPCLLGLLDDKSVETLAKLYGACMFTHKNLQDLIKRCKRQPSLSKFLENTKNDPRMLRRSPEDCLTILVQRWTKVEVLFSQIKSKTLNQSEELEAFDEVEKKVRHLLNSAEGIMAELEHAEKLREFCRLITIREPKTDNMDTYNRLLMEMQCSTTKLINYDQLLVFPTASATTQPVTVTGVALSTCFFLLERVPDTPNYILYKQERVPEVIWWTRQCGLFRKSGEKSGFAFFIVLHSSNTLTRFRCHTMGGLSRWEKVLTEGFSKYRGPNYVDLTTWKHYIQQERFELSMKWANTEKWLEHMASLDNALLSALTARNLACSAAIHETLTFEQLLKEKGGRYSLKSTNKPDESPQILPVESSLSIDLQQMLESKPNFISEDVLHHKAFHLFNSFNECLKVVARALLGQITSGVTRSASDVCESSAIKKGQPVRKIKTFGASDIDHGKAERKHLFRRTSRRGDDSSSPVFQIEEKLDFSDLPDALVSNLNRLTENLKNMQWVEQMLLSLDCLYQFSQDLCVIVCETQAKNTELAARVASLTTKVTSTENVMRQIEREGIRPGLPNGQIALTDDTAGASSHDAVTTSFAVQQETEKLRREYEKFTQECANWEKRRQHEKNAIEREQESLVKAKKKLADERTELAKAQALYQENCKTLQQQINLHSANMSSNLDTLSLPELRIEEPSSPERSSLLNRNSLHLIQQPRRPASFYPENESSSECEREADCCDSASSRERINISKTTFPDHTSGSLLNEPSGLGLPDRLSAIKYTDPQSTLARLATTSKPKKHKKSKIFKW